jgi:phycobilisome core-membrane linker protein
MLNSREYNDCFGEDTVPYERYLTPADRNARKVPGLTTGFEPSRYIDPVGRRRPEARADQALRTTADITPRNLPDRRTVIRGVWSAKIAGGETAAPPSPARSAGPGSLRTSPPPSRRWRADDASPFWTTPGGAGFRPAVAPAPVAGIWSKTVSTNLAAVPARQPGAAMTQALRPGQPQGFRRRQSIGRPVRVGRTTSEVDIQTAIEAVYRQLLNRVPLAAERLTDSESQFRNGQLTVAEFVAVVACSDLFQERLNRLAPLRAAAAAHLSLLGRAAQPSESSRFLALRTGRGLLAAIEDLLNSADYASAFGQDTVPFVRGLATSDGVPLATVNRTAALYGGNAGLTPSPKGAI